MLAIVIATAGTARGDDWTVTVDGDCADAEAFRARAETQRVGDGVVDGVAIHVALTPVAAPIDGPADRAPSDGPADREAPAAWHVRVDVATTGGAVVTRELDGASCAAVNDAAILIVAQLLDGIAAPAPPPPVGPPRTFARIPDEPVPAPSLAEPVSIRLAAAIGGDVGMLPAATAGGRLALEVGWWRVVASLGVTRWRAVTELDDRGQGLTASAWQMVAAVRFRLARRIELGPQIEIGQLDGRGRGVDTELSAAGAWQAIGGVARGRLWARGGLEVALQFEVLAPLGAPTFVLDGEPRYRPDIAVRGMVTLAWTLFDGNRGIWP